MSAGLATSEELRLFLGAESDDFDAQRADFLLAGVSAEVRAFARGQAFSAVVGDIALLDGKGSNTLLLPHVPVTNLTSVLEGASLLDGSSIEWNSDGIIRRTDGGLFANRFRYYAVTYDHGLVEIPADVKLLVCRVAARGWQNPTSLTQESAAGYVAGYGYDATRFVMLNDYDRDQLRTYMP